MPAGWTCLAGTWCENGDRTRDSRGPVPVFAPSGEFHAEASDLDFLVEFEPLEPGDRADPYFGLLHGLEDLFARKIDLVTIQAIRNPWSCRTKRGQDL